MTGRRNVGLNVHRNLDGFIKDGTEGCGWDGGGGGGGSSTYVMLVQIAPTRKSMHRKPPLWLSVALRPGTETVGLLRTGAQDVHLDFHTAPEL